MKYYDLMSPKKKRDFWISEFNDKNILNKDINDSILEKLFYDTFET